MGINKKMLGLGSKRSIIREIFEYSKTRAAEIGSDKVFDFSLGNPSVPAPEEVNEAIRQLLEEKSSVALHGYTSAQGDASVRRAISDKITREHGQWFDIDGIKYMALYHPAALLRDPHKKPDTFVDLKALQAKIQEVCDHTY